MFKKLKDYAGRNINEEEDKGFIGIIAYCCNVIFNIQYSYGRKFGLQRTLGTGKH